MRAALFLATASVVANARSKWRADRAMLPAPAPLYQQCVEFTGIIPVFDLFLINFEWYWYWYLKVVFGLF